MINICVKHALFSDKAIPPVSWTKGSTATISSSEQTCCTILNENADTEPLGESLSMTGQKGQLESTYVNSYPMSDQGARPKRRKPPPPPPEGTPPPPHPSRDCKR